MTDHPSEEAFLALQEKVDGLVEKLSQHIESETADLAVIKKQLEEHLDAHKKSEERWKQAIVGALFSAIGFAVLALGKWLYTLIHNAPTP